MTIIEQAQAETEKDLQDWKFRRIKSLLQEKENATERLAYLDISIDATSKATRIDSCDISFS